MDGPFYVDSRAPHMDADFASVTLGAAAKAMIPIAGLPILGANYFGWRGKKVRQRIFGRIVTAATPGNGTFSLYWGSGADATGTVLASSPAFALTASMTTGSSFLIELVTQCRAMGATGSLFTTGFIQLLNSATVTTAAVTYNIPNAAPAPVTVDLTAANVLSPQFLRSGSTVETLQVHDYTFEALN